MKTSDVAAIVVAYNPDPATLIRTLSALASQTKNLIVVDNASREFPHEALTIPIQYIRLDCNLGIAAGLNAGIQHAQKQGCTHVLLMDQDSQADPHMISQLETTHSQLTQQGKKVAAVGPSYRDAKDGTLAPFFRFSFLGMRRVWPSAQDPVVEVDFLISSGSLVSLEALASIGLMDEGLFIDHVDTEWCLRAQTLGFSLYGTANTQMRHSLGDRRQKLWFFRMYQVPFHAPFRYYYMFRNSLILYQRKSLPVSCTRVLMFRCVKFLLFFGVVPPRRFENLAMMFRGLKDGWQGQLGKMPDPESHG